MGRLRGNLPLIRTLTLTSIPMVMQVETASRLTEWHQCLIRENNPAGGGGSVLLAPGELAFICLRRTLQLALSLGADVALSSLEEAVDERAGCTDTTEPLEA